MGESKFTKGPWQRDKYGTVIANGNTLLVTGVAMPCGYNEGESEANANLIAAAPEMYELLEAVNEWHLMQGEIGAFQIEIDKVLAKARGES